MKLKLTIDLNNSAFSFDDDEGPENGINGNEIGRIFKDAARKYSGRRVFPAEIPIYDINGNRVGESKITK